MMKMYNVNNSSGLPPIPLIRGGLDRQLSSYFALNQIIGVLLIGLFLIPNNSWGQSSCGETIFTSCIDNATLLPNCTILKGPTLVDETDCGHAEGDQYTFEYRCPTTGSGSCIQLVEIQFPTPPTISCPPDQTVSANSKISADVSSVVTTGGCGSSIASTTAGPVTVVSSTLKTITYTTTDMCGNSSTCTQNFNIVPINSEPDCDLIDITADKGLIQITNLNAPIEIVKVFDSNWNIIFNCVANCNDTESINVVPGKYFVSVDLFTASWKKICSEQKDITVTESGSTDDSGNDDGNDDGNDGNSLEEVTCGEITITYGDGSINLLGLANTEYIYMVSRIRPDWNPYLNCAASPCASSQNLTNLPEGTYYIRTWSKYWQPICAGIEIDLVEGSNEIIIEYPIPIDPEEEEEEDSPVESNLETQQCGEVQISYGNGMINALGASGKNYFFKISKRFGDWSHVLNCIKDCGNEANLENLSPGEYGISIFNSDWSKACESTTIELTSGKLKVSSFNTQVPLFENTKKSFKKELAIYPNPANQELLIDIPDYTNQKGVIQLINQFGQIVQQVNLDGLSAQSIRLDLQEVNTGLHFVRISVGKEQTISEKIMIVR